MQLLQFLLQDNEWIIDDVQTQVELHWPQKILCCALKSNTKDFKINYILIKRCKQCFQIKKFKYVNIPSTNKI